MKKKSLLLIFVFAMFLFAPFVRAEEVLGDELVEHGDFSFSSGELLFPDPVFGSEYGVAEGWGTLAFDSQAKAIVDPGDPENTVLKLSLTNDGENWSSFFRFMSIDPDTTYDISIDYKIVGTTDNIGFRFAGADVPALEEVFLDHDSKTAIDGKDDWYNVQFSFTTDPGTAYDSIAAWFNTMGSTDNYALLDNVFVFESGSDQNLNVGGDFEGFLDYAPSGGLTTETNSYGFYGEEAQAGNGNATVADQGYLGYDLALDAGTYQTAFDFEIADITDADVTLSYIDDQDAIITSIPLVESGTIDTDLVTDDGGVYSVATLDELSTDAVALEIAYEGGSELIIDNLSVKESITVPDNPFDPDTTYYESENLIVNGDFEAFDTGTVFSEDQLEGAWGSVSLDGPAEISEVDGSKVMDIGLTEGKTYSSAFVMTPPELDVDDLLRLSFDYKLNLNEDAANYTEINTSFVGASNTPYYTINFKDLNDGDLTEGAELLNMPLVVEDLGDGWANVTLDFQVSAEFLIKCNSIRWLFTPLHEDDGFYVDNVSLHYLSDEEPVVNVESLSINEGDQDLYVGDETDLTVEILPDDAEDKSVVWSSSNEDVATVDENGRVTAVDKGAVTITVETSDGSVSDDVVVTVMEAESEGLSTGWIVTIVGGSVVVLAGAALLVFKSKIFK